MYAMPPQFNVLCFHRRTLPGQAWLGSARIVVTAFIYVMSAIYSKFKLCIGILQKQCCFYSSSSTFLVDYMTIIW